ncbi:MAG: hypothetical protein QM687_02410 [Ferruginibacter sp.]
MKKYFAVFTAAAIVLSACGGSDSPEVDRSIMPDSAKAATPAVNTALPVAPVPVNPGTQALPAPTPEQVKQAVTIPAEQASKVVAGAGLNPAHGQPGHRCDIAVGAPLNSAPAAQPAVQATPSVQTTPAATAPVITGAGLNPAHGQPGHDCSIPVGAPLKKG